MEPLTDTEKMVVAIALNGLAMRHGPLTFEIVISIAKKLGCYDEMEKFLKDWIACEK